MWSVALRGPCCGGLNAVRVPHRRQKRHCCAHHVAAHNSVHRRAPDWRIVARINRHGATMGCPWVGERSVNCPSAKNLPSSSASRRYGRREAHRRPSWSPTSLRIRARSSGWNIAVPRTILRATFRLTNASPAASTANNSSLSGAPNPPRVSATYPATTSTRRWHRGAGAARRVCVRRGQLGVWHHRQLAKRPPRLPH